MYLPGIRGIALFLIAALVSLLALSTGSVLPLAVLAAILVAYAVHSRSEAILEMFYKDRVLLLEPLVKVLVKKDYIIFYLKNKYIVSAFIKVKDIDVPETDTKLGEAATFFLSNLHAPSITVNVIADPRPGGYAYYLKVNMVVKESPTRILEGFSSFLAEFQRRLLSTGVYATPAPPREALEPVAELVEKRYAPTLPLLTVTTIIVVCVLLLANPPLAVLPAAIAPLIPLELKLAKGGKTVITPRRLIPLSYSSELSLEPVRVGSRIRSMSKALAWSGETIFALLVPEDPAKLQAMAARAMEVLEAGRVGASRLADEFKAVDLLQLRRAVERGSMPFKAVVASSEGGRSLAPFGIRPEFFSFSSSGTLLKMLRALLGLPECAASKLSVSEQLAWLSPYAYIKPRTTRTRRAIYLGRGVRRDEKVYLEIDLLENVHGLIIGPMGSGKSTTARTIAVRALEKGFVPVIVDPSGEYRSFAARFGFELVDLADKPFNIFDSRVEDFEKAIQYLSPLSEYESQLLRRLYEKEVSTLAEALKNSKETSLEWKLKRLEPYFGKPALSVKEVLSEGAPLVLCMGSTASGRYVSMPVEIQRLAFSLLLAQMRDFALARGLSEPRWLLIVDEAHLFAHPPPGMAEPEVATLARMLRKFGLAVILLTHDWVDVPESFRRAAGWKMALSHSDPDYITMTQTYMALNPTELVWLKRGVRGRAVLRRGLDPHNILVEIEPVEGSETPG